MVTKSPGSSSSEGDEVSEDLGQIHRSRVTKINRIRKENRHVEVTGPKSRCPECLMDFSIFMKEKCSGCGNDYEGWDIVESD